MMTSTAITAFTFLLVAGMQLCLAQEAAAEAIAPILCQDVQCREYCDYYEYDSAGCRICKCYNPCQFIRCAPGYKCEIQHVVCVKYPCYPIAKCVPDCQPLLCDRKCQNYVNDSRGCPTCECYKPCAGYKCPPNQICTYNKVTCLGQTYIVPKCIAYTCPRPVAIETQFCLRPAHQCIDHDDCPANQVCCLQGCVRQCIYPRRAVLSELAIADAGIAERAEP